MHILNLFLILIEMPQIFHTTYFINYRAKMFLNTKDEIMNLILLICLDIGIRCWFFSWYFLAI